MMGFELQQALDETLAMNAKAIKSMREAGVGKARAEARYRSELAKKMLQLRSHGFPASMVKDVARGDDKVSEAEFAAECALVEYDACKEEVMLRKREADVIREQLAREWGAQR